MSPIIDLEYPFSQLAVLCRLVHHPKILRDAEHKPRLILRPEPEQRHAAPVPLVARLVVKRPVAELAEARPVKLEGVTVPLGVALVPDRGRGDVRDERVVHDDDARRGALARYASRPLGLGPDVVHDRSRQLVALAGEIGLDVGGEKGRLDGHAVHARQLIQSARHGYMDISNTESQMDFSQRSLGHVG